ncbi:MAG: SCO family protein [Parvibaculum sp.]|jgi:protein SCO1/2|uniref:SCO family protein n=1 Tax=Parvibaculum sp. TaxID=2024848 RepID=UPI00283BCE96|nr:SCO family protein [Parvibaculum sp.]MDR3500784.1 SCO family protein [Parvibaculum sp.]
MTPIRTIALVAAFALAIVAAVWLWRSGDGLAVNKGASGEAGQAQGTGKPLVGGPFAMTDQNGKPVTDQTFRGRYMLIYFGFTFCPDVCPTELQVMAGAMQKLGAKAEKVQPIFVTIDPDRDTPAVLAQYVKQFDPRLIGLTGTAAQTAAIAKAYRVFYEKVKDEQNAADYSMDHSSIVYLMGPDGGFLAFFPPATGPDEMAAKIASFF